MAIAEDVTNSPARVVSSGATTTTAAFTPPNAGCIIVAFMFGDANTGALDEALTPSDSLAGTWSTPVLDNARGGAAVAIAYRIVAAGTAASMTVSVTDNKGSVAKGLYARIFTGTDLTNPFGATGVAGTSNITLVSTVANSLCVSALLTSNVLQVAGANTAQQTEFGGFDGGDSIGVYYSTITTSTAGTSITLAETGGTPVHNVAVELVPPGGGPATVNATVNLAAGAQLAAAAVVTKLGAVTFGAGAAMVAAATQTGFAAVTMAAGASLTATGGVTELGAVTMAAGAALTSAATRTVLPGVGFAAGAALAAAGSRTATVAVQFAAGAVLLAAPATPSTLTPTVLVAGGANPATLVPGGTGTATLIASGAATGTLVAGGV